LAGGDLLARARRLDRPGPYQLKAAIAAVHAGARRADLTDWATIVRLYDHLLQWEPTPVVQLNRAVAIAMAEGPAAGLALLDDPTLAEVLIDYHLYHLTRADLLRRDGRSREAALAYQQARRQTNNAAEHRFLDRRLMELEELGDAAAGG
jgi:RNA polymerase sigma-70 factor (ECF subfamily)